MKENNSLHKSLVKAVLSTMENIAFEEPEVLPDPVNIEGETVSFSLQVVSPYLLLTRVDIPKKLAMKLTQIIYRNGEIKTTDALVDDTIGEFLNTIIGTMMGNLTLGERIFEMGLPQKITGEERAPSTNAREFYFSLADFPFCVTVDGEAFVDTE